MKLALISAIIMLDQCRTGATLKDGKKCVLLNEFFIPSKITKRFSDNIEI